MAQQVIALPAYDPQRGVGRFDSERLMPYVTINKVVRNRALIATEVVIERHPMAIDVQFRDADGRHIGFNVTLGIASQLRDAIGAALAIASGDVVR
jgi:hypothetical protein